MIFPDPENIAVPEKNCGFDALGKGGTLAWAALVRRVKNLILFRISFSKINVLAILEALGGVHGTAKSIAESIIFGSRG